jgi:hypothetical protein
MYKPAKRKHDLLLEHLQGDCIVYDNSNKKVHHLNSTLAWVWNHCDGIQSVHELAAAMSDELGFDNANEIVATSLKQLADANLLESNSIDVSALPVPEVLVSRRTVMASAVVIAPAMVSILAPTPAAAKSKPDKIKSK